MARHKSNIIPEHYYHLYNRGNNKQDIFSEKENYLYFMDRIYNYYDPVDINLIDYCLIPNHFHLLIYFDREVDFSNIMRSLTCSYVKSYNKWYGRTGHLFQGDFQYKEIEREGYLTHLCRYIHLNPVKAQLVRLPEEWEFSDYREWTSGEPPTSVKVLDHVEVGGLSKLSLRQILIGSAEDYKIFVMDFAEEQKMDLKINKMLFG